MKISTRSITLAATLAALCAATGLLPYVFFLPVMVAATTLSIGMVAFVGLAFGCISLAYCFLNPASPVAVAFISAPYIPIVTRVLAAVATFGVYKLAQKLIKPQKRLGQAATVSLSAALGSLFNTAFVVGLLVLVMPNKTFSVDGGTVSMLALAPFLLVDAAIECACMAVITPPISLTLKKAVLREPIGASDKAAFYKSLESIESGGDAKVAEPEIVADNATASAGTEKES